MTSSISSDSSSRQSVVDDPSRDLGFGSEVGRNVYKRLLNRDGTFNVVRFGLNPL